MDTKNIAKTGMLVAVAFVLSYVESMLPLNFGVPGIKVGLSNIVVLFKPAYSILHSYCADNIMWYYFWKPVRSALQLVWWYFKFYGNAVVKEDKEVLCIWGKCSRRGVP